MRIKTVLLFILAVAGMSSANAAPAQLYGKTIQLSWNENRELRREGETDFHGSAIGQHVTIYVSPTGKLFNRWEATTRRGRKGNNDQVAGEGGSSRGVSFRGNQLEVFNPHSGFMRHLVADFDSSFASCTMKASYPSDTAGGPKKMARTLVSGQATEFRNMSASGESCSIQAGNAFAQ